MLLLIFKEVFIILEDDYIDDFNNLFKNFNIIKFIKHKDKSFVELEHNLCGEVYKVRKDSLLNRSPDKLCNRCCHKDIYFKKLDCLKNNDSFKKFYLVNYRNKEYIFRCKHCSVEFSKYLFKDRFDNKILCPNCDNPSERYKNDLNPEFIMLSDYKPRNCKTGIRGKILLKHIKNNCNHEFLINSDVNPKNITCPVCKIENLKLDFQKELDLKFPNEFQLLSNYKNLHSKVLIKHNCIFCKGKPFKVTANDLYRFGNCKSCEEVLNSLEYVSKRVVNLLGDSYVVVSESFVSNTQFEIKHISDYCNNYIHSRPLSYLESGRGGCPICNHRISINEHKIMDYLDSLCIDYEQEKCFTKFVIEETGGHPRYDFYITYNNKNALIEYDGEQHFIETNKWKTDLKDIQYRDKLKDDYARDNNIPLLRIPYTEKNNIEYLIDKFINEL